MKHAVKLLSAVALLGSAFVSFNAQAEGGCPAGSYPTQGAGWKGCTPVYNSGSPTPSRSNDDDTTPYIPMDKNALTLAYAIDKKTDKVTSQWTTLLGSIDITRQFQRECPECHINSFKMTSDNGCVTLYKYPETGKKAGKGLFSRPTSYTYIEYGETYWRSSESRKSSYEFIKDKNGTPIKDICLK